MVLSLEDARRDPNAFATELGRSDLTDTDRYYYAGLGQQLNPNDAQANANWTAWYNAMNPQAGPQQGDVFFDHPRFGNLNYSQLGRDIGSSDVLTPDLAMLGLTRTLPMVKREIDRVTGPAAGIQKEMLGLYETLKAANGGQTAEAPTGDFAGAVAARSPMAYQGLQGAAGLGWTKPMPKMSGVMRGMGYSRPGLIDQFPGLGNLINYGPMNDYGYGLPPNMGMSIGRGFNDLAYGYGPGGWGSWYDPYIGGGMDIGGWGMGYAEGGPVLTPEQAQNDPAAFAQALQSPDLSPIDRYYYAGVGAYLNPNDQAAQTNYMNWAKAIATVPGLAPPGTILPVSPDIPDSPESVWNTEDAFRTFGRGPQRPPGTEFGSSLTPWITDTGQITSNYNDTGASYMSVPNYTQPGQMGDSFGYGAAAGRGANTYDPANDPYRKRAQQAFAEGGKVGRTGYFMGGLFGSPGRSPALTLDQARNDPNAFASELDRSDLTDTDRYYYAGLGAQLNPTNADAQLNWQNWHTAMGGGQNAGGIGRIMDAGRAFNDAAPRHYEPDWSNVRPYTGDRNKLGGWLQQLIGGAQRGAQGYMDFAEGGSVRPKIPYGTMRGENAENMWVSQFRDQPQEWWDAQDDNALEFARDAYASQFPEFGIGQYLMGAGQQASAPAAAPQKQFDQGAILGEPRGAAALGSNAGSVFGGSPVSAGGFSGARLESLPPELQAMNEGIWKLGSVAEQAMAMQDYINRKKAMGLPVTETDNLVFSGLVSVANPDSRPARENYETWLGQTDSRQNISTPFGDYSHYFRKTMAPRYVDYYGGGQDVTLSRPDIWFPQYAYNSYAYQPPEKAA